MKDQKLVLIIERSMADLAQVQSETDDKNYVFEGIFAEITDKNNKNRNQRYYTKEEYLPQIEMLQKVIEQNSLLGEIDHPDRFNVKMSEASHRVEKLEFRTDEDGVDRVYGRIRLLNTSKGKEAKALADDGVPLKISSRAAGVVESDGKVKFKKLFTYDIVNEPGFENANLHRINESLGIDDENIDVYEFIDESKIQDEDLNDKEKETKEELEEKETKENLIDENLKKNENSNLINNSKKKEKSTMGYVTEERMEKYSKHVKEYYESLNKKIETVLEEKEQKIKQLIAHNDHLVESMTKMQKYLDYIHPYINGGNESLAKIQEDVSLLKKYSEHLSEVINENADESAETKDTTKKLIAYNNYIAENFDKVNETVTNLIEFSDYIAENTHHSIKHSDYIVEHVEKIGAYANYISESINESFGEGQGKAKPIFEDVIDQNLNKIAESVDNLISKSTKGKEAEEREIPTFLTLLGESKTDDYFNFPEELQTKINEAFDEKQVRRSSVAKKVWADVIHDYYNWEEMVPESLKESWDRLPEDKRNHVREQAEMHDLTSPELIQNFWETRDLKHTDKYRNPFSKRREISESKVNESIDGDRYKSLISEVKRFSGRL